MNLQNYSYRNRYAELYDLFYSHKNYATEVDFIDKVLKQNGIKKGASILDTACGTGNHGIQLSKLGYKVEGLDLSPEMVGRAKEKCAELTWNVQDMATLNKTAQFDVILCLFDSIGYLVETEKISQFLSRVHTALKPNGVFLCEFWHAPAMLNGYDKLRTTKYQLEDREIIRLSETTLLPNSNLVEVQYTVYEMLSQGTYRKTQEKHVNRFFTTNEILELLDKNRLASVHSFSGYQKDLPITDQTWHVVTLARKS